MKWLLMIDRQTDIDTHKYRWTDCNIINITSYYNILLEKGMATHSSILAWKIPWTEEFIGWQRAGHNWVTNIHTHTHTHTHTYYTILYYTIPYYRHFIISNLIPLRMRSSYFFLHLPISSDKHLPLRRKLPLFQILNPRGPSSKLPHCKENTLWIKPVF